MSNKEMIPLRIDLEGDTKEMFEKIKKHFNLNTNTETLRLIIKMTYDSYVKKE